MRKAERVLFKNWEEIVAILPDDLDKNAKKYGALARKREIQSAQELLRIILIYAVVSSLRVTAIWTVGLKICDTSREVIEKSVIKSEAWLSYLLNELLKQKIDLELSAKSNIKRIILRDASVISRPKSHGTEWRLHLSWSPFTQTPTQITLTDHSSGEGVEDAGLEAGDLVLGDRAYGLWKTIRPLLDQLIFFVFRFTYTNPPLVNPDSTTFDVVKFVKQMEDNALWSETTIMARDNTQQRPFRLIVGCLPEEKAKEARERYRRQAKKDKRTPNPYTLFLAGFCLLVTNLPADSWSASLTLSLYRVQWQIEWTFRRWKSICRLDVLPSYPAPIAKPVLLAKLILIFLMQESLSTGPWSQWWQDADQAPIVSSLVEMAILHLHEIVRPTYVFRLVLDDPERFRRHLFSSKRKDRLWQLARATQLFPSLTF